MSDIREKAADEMFCTHCRAIIKKAAELCPKCGCRVSSAPASAQTMPPPDDKVSFGLGFLSFIIPLVGLIVFVVLNKYYPRKAKSCGIGALVGFVVGVAFSLIVANAMGDY